MSDSAKRLLLRGAEEKIFDNMWAGATDSDIQEWLRIPLQIAAGEGDLDLVEKLQHAGANGDALHPAIRGGHTDMVCDMLMVGQSMSRRDRDGNTPLHVAADLGCDDIVRLLLLKGASPHMTNDESREPLHLAVENGHLSAAKALLIGGAHANGSHPRTTDSPLHMATACGDEDMMRTLIQYGANVDATSSAGGTALHVAAAKNMTGAIDVLVENSADVDFPHERRSPVLLEDSADVDFPQENEGSTPLKFAISSLRYEAALSLLQHGADVGAWNDNDGLPPLHVAAILREKGGAELVDLLLRWGASEAGLDWDGRTPADLLTKCSVNPACPHVKRTKQLLCNAAQDRAWRRRGLPILCRAFPDRLLLDPGAVRKERKAWLVPAVTKVQKVDTRTHEHVLFFGKHPRTEEEAGSGDNEEFFSEDGGGGGRVREERRGGTGEFNSRTVSLLLGLEGLEEDDLFRNIVGFL